MYILLTTAVICDIPEYKENGMIRSESLPMPMVIFIPPNNRRYDCFSIRKQWKRRSD